MDAMYYNISVLLLVLLSIAKASPAVNVSDIKVTSLTGDVIGVSKSDYELFIKVLVEGVPDENWTIQFTTDRIISEYSTLAPSYGFGTDTTDIITTQSSTTEDTTDIITTQSSTTEDTPDIIITPSSTIDGHRVYTNKTKPGTWEVTLEIQLYTIPDKTQINYGATVNYNGVNTTINISTKTIEFYIKSQSPLIMSPSKEPIEHFNTWYYEKRPWEKPGAKSVVLKAEMIDRQIKNPIWKSQTAEYRVNTYTDEYAVEMNENKNEVYLKMTYAYAKRNIGTFTLTADLICNEEQTYDGNLCYDYNEVETHYYLDATTDCSTKEIIENGILLHEKFGKIRYACKPGYEFQDQSKEDKWFSDCYEYNEYTKHDEIDKPVCIKSECEFPTKVGDSHILSREFVYGNRKAKYECDIKEKASHAWGDRTDVKCTFNNLNKAEFTIPDCPKKTRVLYTQLKETRSGFYKVQVSFDAADQDRTWGSICDDGWSSVESNVVCKALGYKFGDLVRSNSNLPFLMTHVKCETADEKSKKDWFKLEDCSYSKYDKYLEPCEASEAVGVRCYNEVFTANIVVEEMKSNSNQYTMQFSINDFRKRGKPINIFTTSVFAVTKDSVNVYIKSGKGEQQVTINEVKRTQQMYEISFKLPENEDTTEEQCIVIDFFGVKSQCSDAKIYI